MATATDNRITTAATESCPTWCDVDHTGDYEGDVIHRGATAVMTVPEESACPTPESKRVAPRLTAHVVLPELTEEPEAPAMVVVDLGDLWGPYAELDLEQTDEFIRQGKAFLARVEQMRDQLAAALKETQS